MKLTSMPKKVMPLAELSILDVVFVATMLLLLDFLDRRIQDCLKRENNLPDF